jgi:hypothetical protein
MSQESAPPSRDETGIVRGFLHMTAAIGLFVGIYYATHEDFRKIFEKPDPPVSKKAKEDPATKKEE